MNDLAMTQRTLRWGNLKYGYNCWEDELYDLSMDPHEARNLIGHSEGPVKEPVRRVQERGVGGKVFTGWKEGPIAWINLVSFLHGLGVFSSQTVLPVYMKDLGGTDFLVSLSMALFYLVRGLLTFFSGTFSDTSGRRGPIVLALALFSSAHVCYALSRTPTAILASIAVQATAAGLYWPVVFALISGHSGPGESARNISKFLSALGIGGIAGSWLGGVVADLFSPQITFWLGFAVLALACLAFWLFIPEDGSPGNGGRFRLGDIFSVSSEVRSLSLLAAGATVVWVVFNVGMPLWLRGLGASYTFIGGTRAAASGANLGVVALAPFLVDRLGFRLSLSLYLLLCGLTMIGVNISSSLLLAAALFSLFWGSSGMEVVGWTSSVERTSPEGKVGASMGMLRGLRDLFTLGYLLAFGILAQYWSMRGAFIFVAVVLTGLSGMVWVYLRPQKRRELWRSSL
ncbi:MAG TPA: MFS transporter [Candidatus Latescibacteria bacterium]|nr:MFS transporter [Candidatus Latescibacterota bacterium]